MAGTHDCPRCGASPPPDQPGRACPHCSGTGASSTSPSAIEPGARPVDLAGFRLAALGLGLVSAEDLDRFAEGAGGDVSRLSRSLVLAGKLTSYQAGALAQGRARGLAIGPYLALEKRGQGGMGVVFKARHRDSGRVVALKILLPTFSRDREAVTRFRREFEVAARLGHPNVVAALEASEDRGVQFLTMEYVEGHDLEDLVRAVGPLPVKLSLHCAIQAARGLAAAHAQGIVHRDVKPGNLMLDPTGAVRVLDLGLARIVEAANPLGRGEGPALTQAGTYLGTVDFIAPEQADDSKRADHRADIYSLGCTLHYLLTGRPPFEGETILQRLMAHQQRPAPSLLVAREDVPEALESAYRAMMAKRPADRPGSMAEVIGLLEGCRSSADEAKQAGAGLRSFAEAAMKRASPRKRDRSRDASVFARPSEPGGLRIGPDLRLEDVVDYRDEVKPGPLDEDQLPPPIPRTALPRRGYRRRGKAPLAAVALAFLGLAVAGYTLTNRGAGPAAGGRSPSSPGLGVMPIAIDRPPIARDPNAWTPLFNGRDLTGWLPHDGRAEDWKVEGGELVVKGRDVPYMSILTAREYASFRLRFEFRASKGTNSGVMLWDSDRAGKRIDLAEVNISELGHPQHQTGLIIG